MTDARRYNRRRHRGVIQTIGWLAVNKDIEDYEVEADAGDDVVDVIRTALEHGRGFSIETEPL